MHKIKKGIKKKIKGKKHKDEEIFTEEELENYKKRIEEEARSHLDDNQEGEPEEPIGLSDKDHEVPSESPAEPNTEETPEQDWKDFLGTTDSVLKKTSENLKHIKEVSYFQVKKSEEQTVQSKEHSFLPSQSDTSNTQKKHWVDLDKGGVDESDEEETREESESQVEQVEEEPVPEKPKGEHIELKPIEDLPSVAVEDYADIFDTTYVDNVESGKVKLYYIPDSPTEEDFNEPDPFDTSEVNKILHIEEPPKPEKSQYSEHPNKKKNNLVNLGSAVKVLTGETTPNDINADDETNAEIKEADLLVNFEEKDKDQCDLEAEAKPEAVENSVDETCLVDDILFFEEENDSNLPDVVPPLTVKSLFKQASKEKEQETSKQADSKHEEGEDLTQLLDPLAIKDRKVESGSDLQDLVAEFDVINSEETEKDTEVILNAIDDNIEDEFDAEFAVLAAESLAKEKEKQIDEIGILDDDDPFDTSSVKKVLGKTKDFDCELNIVEEDPFDVSIANDVLGNHFDDLSAHISKDIQRNQEIVDPFDTSIAAEVLPADPFELVGEINLPDTLKPDAKHLVLKSPEELDPFDTSAATSFGKVELKVLEGELLDDISKDTGDDFDFNPRAEEQINIEPKSPPTPTCLLSSSPGGSEAAVLTPLVKSSPTEEVDPFDTSFAEKAQLKNLEEELLSTVERKSSTPVNLTPHKPPPRPPGPSILPATCKIAENVSVEVDPFDTSIADQFEIPQEQAPSIEDKIDLKLNLKPPRPPSPSCLLATTPVDQNPILEPLTGNSVLISNSQEEEFDPFDTTIAEQFGKTELKVLATELLTTTIVAPVQIAQVDDEFDPREGEVIQKQSKPSPSCLLTSVQLEDDQQVPVLAPLGINTIQEDSIDPFDTSIAEKFGKSELEYLESELLSDIPRKSISFPPTFEEEEKPQKPLRPPSPSVCVFAITPTDTNPALQPSAFIEKSKENTSPEDYDPFDTSIADQFGKTELKALEESLFSEESSEKVSFSKALILDTTKVSCPPLAPESPTPANSNPDTILCISPSAEDLPVLQPSINSLDLDQIPDDLDPFDTSIADKLGKTELKAIERVLVDSGRKRSLSDDEFDPRGDEIKSTKKN